MVSAPPNIEDANITMWLKSFLIRRGLPGKVARDVGLLFLRLSLQNPSLDPERIAIEICSISKVEPQANILEVVNSIIAKYVDHPFEVSTEYGLLVERIVRDQLRIYMVPVRYLIQCSLVPTIDLNVPYERPSTSCKSLPFSLIGRWRDETSIHEIFSDGRYLAKYDDGSKAEWTWSVSRRRLALMPKEYGETRHFYIADITRKSYAIKSCDMHNDIFIFKRL